MPRLKGWRPALFAAIDAHRGKPFQWGVHDCAVLAADAVAAMTGEDLAAAYRGKYTDRDGAGLLLAEHGFLDAVALAADRFEEIPVSRAGVGDLAAIPIGSNSVPVELQGVGSLALGIVTGPVIAVMTAKGLSSVPLAAAVRAFRVG